MSQDVLFVGLGNMGLPMAINLVKAGHRVHGHDLTKINTRKLVDAGGVAVLELGKAASTADALITMLPTGKHVESVCLGPGALVECAKPSAVLIDCSSIAPITSRSVSQAAAARGLACIDAPVSGGTAGAAAATLTFMVGGPAVDLDRARPFLESMGKAVFHAGESGAGQTAKICNNMMLGIQMVGACETIRLGMALGMDPTVLSKIVSASSGRNWVFENYNPCPGVMDNVPAAHGYNGGFAVDLMLKDLGLAVESSIAAQACIPMGALARNLFDLHSKSGAGGLDMSSIFRALARKDV